ncbi:MAG: hypothetical protein HN929_00850 [Chloroflexi bacterium]|jgi:hypothetical protein|nr:hypothetical protein [Chloroflexota bacterium]MBT7080013.1 hypothetical protein [Chloroflexota bacterium]
MSNSLGPRNVDSILADTVRIYWNSASKLLRISAIIGVPLAVLAGVSNYWTARIVYNGNITNYSILWVIMILALGFILPLIAVVASAFSHGALMNAVSEQFVRDDIDVYRSFRSAWKRVQGLIVVTIIATVIVCGLSITVVGIPLAIYYAIRWIFALQAVLFEGIAPLTALDRSSKLVEDNWWRIFGIMAILVIIAGAIAIGFFFIPTVGLTLFIAVFLIVSLPIIVIGNTMLYFDVRVRKEEYNKETLLKELTDVESGVHYQPPLL